MRNIVIYLLHEGQENNLFKIHKKKNKFFIFFAIWTISVFKILKLNILKLNYLISLPQVTKKFEEETILYTTFVHITTFRIQREPIWGREQIVYYQQQRFYGEGDT